MQIVDYFYQLAREHKRINAFYYGKAYEKGAGDTVYPCMWLDDPLNGSLAPGPEVGKGLRWNVNLDILGLPKTLTVPEVQDAAFSIGLGIVEYSKKIRPQTHVTVESANFISLRDYYDDNAAGWRFSYTLLQINPVNKCAPDWDPDKQFTPTSPLPEFLVANPQGCAIFATKKGLPDFSVAP